MQQLVASASDEYAGRPNSMSLLVVRTPALLCLVVLGSNVSFGLRVASSRTRLLVAPAVEVVLPSTYQLPRMQTQGLSTRCLPSRTQASHRACTGALHLGPWPLGRWRVFEVPGNTTGVDGAPLGALVSGELSAADKLWGAHEG